MPVNIHGKDYLTVAERIATFRGEHPEWAVSTEIVSNADVVVIKATVSNDQGALIGTGYAEEVRGSSNINKTSALENCETSAIGRALASCGYGGEQYASANEVTDAIIQQNVQNALAKHVSLGYAIQEHFQSIAAIKENIFNGDLGLAAEAFGEIPENDRMALSVAPTKGGVWTKEEKKVFMSDDWSAARKATFED